MKRLQAYKFELMPNGQQQRQMRRFAGSCRFVFNRALAQQKTWYEADKSNKFSYVKLANLLPSWKKELPWLLEAPSQALQQAIKDLEKAYKNFFAKRSSFPRFKKRSDASGFRFPQGFKIDEGNARIFLPKLGWLRYRKSRSVQGRPCNVTVSSRAGRWYISIQTEREVEVPVPAVTSSIGIDMGIARFATLSDGSFWAPVSSFKQHEIRLARYQRAMSRKQKGSKNWLKAKRRVQRQHSKIANVRNDFLHKASSAIVKAHSTIVIEDLKIRNMSRSAKGTLESPGRNVRAKSGLNKSILDQGWFEFRRQLEYKTAWCGGELIAVNPMNTSRTCPKCGHVSADNRKTQAVFCCIGCGHLAHADHVGAINILARGHRVAACGEVVRHKNAVGSCAASVKQEPTEALALTG